MDADGRVGLSGAAVERSQGGGGCDAADCGRSGGVCDGVWRVAGAGAWACGERGGGGGVCGDGEEVWGGGAGVCRGVCGADGSGLEGAGEAEGVGGPASGVLEEFSPVLGREGFGFGAELGLRGFGEGWGRCGVGGDADAELEEEVLLAGGGAGAEEADGLVGAVVELVGVLAGMWMVWPARTLDFWPRKVASSSPATREKVSSKSWRWGEGPPPGGVCMSVRQ